MSFESEFIKPPEGTPDGPRGAEEVPPSERINDLEVTLRPEDNARRSETGKQPTERPVSDFGAPDGGRPAEEPGGRTVPIDLSKILEELNQRGEYPGTNEQGERPESDLPADVPPPPEIGSEEKAHHSPESQNEGGDDGGDPPAETAESVDDPEEQPLRFTDFYPDGHIIATTDLSLNLREAAEELGMTVVDPRTERLFIELAAGSGMENVKVVRAPIPEDAVPGITEYPGYNPPEITIRRGEVEVGQHEQETDEARLEPRSYISLETGREVPLDSKGQPMNVMGPTGLTGLGEYDHPGPNISAIDLITRISPNDGRLEVLVEVLPGYREEVLLPEMTLTGSESPEDAVEFWRLSTQVQTLQQLPQGKRIYDGYADRDTNTDIAWSETSTNHTHLPPELAEAFRGSTDFDRHDLQWRPINSLFQDDDTPLEPHHALQLRLASERLFREACKPIYEDSIVEELRNGIIEKFEDTGEREVTLANGATTKLPFTNYEQRTVAQLYGPAPEERFEPQEEILLEELPPGAQEAVRAAKDVHEKQLLRLTGLPRYRRLVTSSQPNGEDQLYTQAFQPGAKRPIDIEVPQDLKGLPPDPSVFDKRVAAIEEVADGWIALRREHMTALTYRDDEINFFSLEGKSRQANAFWIAGEGRYVIGFNDPAMRNDYGVPLYMIFPVKFYKTDTEDLDLQR